MANDLAEILDVERSALLVIDVQNDYIHEDGALSKMGKDTTPIRAIVPNVCELIDLARRVDVVRIFVRQTHSHWFNTSGWLTRGAAPGSSRLSAFRSSRTDPGAPSSTPSNPARTSWS